MTVNKFYHFKVDGNLYKVMLQPTDEQSIMRTQWRLMQYLVASNYDGNLMSITYVGKS